MPALSIAKETVLEIFSAKKGEYLIPDYQRPYAWKDDECEKLWSDLQGFAIPNDSYSDFNEDEEYFLGPIVTFKNGQGKLEVIDGQQRLTTILLLLRAFYDKFTHMKDEQSKSLLVMISQCIWKTDPFGKADQSALKINSEVATDEDKEEFLNILKTGKIVENGKSRYAKNYKFFEEKISEFITTMAPCFAYLVVRILKNCILLPIEAENQNTALTIFSTLNDRGKPLSDADIFKAQFYKTFAQAGEKDNFIKDWKNLEEITARIFHPANATPMEELFTRYMYYERAKRGIKSSTTEAQRAFYEGKNEYSLLKERGTFENLKTLADFWNEVDCRSEKFSPEVLRRLFILDYAPNGMWTYIVSVYFMHNKDADGKLDNDKFLTFLDKITAFIYMYAVTNPGVNALRTPIFAEMVNIINDVPVAFADYKRKSADIKSIFGNFIFKNQRPITRSLMTWWAFKDEAQEIPEIGTKFDIEHIFSRNQYAMDGSLSDDSLLECLGNKSLLERDINIAAGDYHFTDKKKYYLGKVGRNPRKTKIKELLALAKTKKDFTEADIRQRNSEIISGFTDFLADNGLIG